MVNKMNLKKFGVKNLMDLKLFIDDLKDNNIPWDQPTFGNFTFDNNQDFELAKQLLK